MASPPLLTPTIIDLGGWLHIISSQDVLEREEYLMVRHVSVTNYWNQVKLVFVRVCVGKDFLLSSFIHKTSIILKH